ncbi:MAG TPA: RNA polymerase factor sigma-54, partial [Woeseiaceae bacterium]|nr:RNA polymerase factor sigma-54 [Woeseiaceae bacterium]
MTPQLQQAIRLLQLPVIDLTAQIQEALEENVMLEVEELPEPPQMEAGPMEGETAGDVRAVTLEDSWRDLPARGQDSGWSGDSRGMSEFPDQSQESLHEHLHWQLELEKFSPREMLIGEAIIDAINDDGYLTVSLEEVRDIAGAELDVSEEEVERTLRKVQRFDPAGIAARSLSECIDLQLRQLAGETPGRDLARELAAEHLERVAENDPAALQRQLQVPGDELTDALALIRSCHPRPGQAIAPSRTEYVIPDVFVRKVDGEWLVEVASSGIPKLSVNQRYAEMLRGNGGHAALKAQLQEARWLVRSLEIRNETLMKVASCIVERQTEFFEHGE